MPTEATLAAHKLAKALEQAATWSRELPLHDHLLPPEFLTTWAERLRNKYVVPPLSDRVKGVLWEGVKEDMQDLSPPDQAEELTTSWDEIDWHQYLEEYEAVLYEDGDIDDRLKEVNAHREGLGQLPLDYTGLASLIDAEGQMEHELADRIAEEAVG